MIATNKLRAALATVVLACALVACGSREVETGVRAITRDITIGSAEFAFDERRIHVGVGERHAEITSAGTLTIDGVVVPLEPSLQPTLARYVEAANGVRESSVQTGLAGAQVGTAAVGAVFDGLLKGETDQIGARVEAKAGAIVAAAATLCEQLAALQLAQDAIVAGAEAFRPFATVGSGQVEACRRDVAKGRARTDAAAAG